MLRFLISEESPSFQLNDGYDIHSIYESGVLCLLGFRQFAAFRFLAKLVDIGRQFVVGPQFNNCVGECQRKDVCAGVEKPVNIGDNVHRGIIQTTLPKEKPLPLRQRFRGG